MTLLLKFYDLFDIIAALGFVYEQLYIQWCLIHALSEYCPA